MALVVSSPLTISNNSAPYNNENDEHHFKHQQLFFRFVDGKNITLTVNPNEEIRNVKVLLIQKLISMNNNKNHKKSSMNDDDDDVSDRVYLYYAIFNFVWFFTLLLLQQKYNNTDLTFMYNGKPIDDDDCINDIIPMMGRTSTTSNNNNITIHVSTRMRGGCFMISASIFILICISMIGSVCTCGMSLFVVPFLLPLLFILPLCCL